MMNILSYIFYPNPVAPSYTNVKVLIALGLVVALIVFAVLFRKKLRKSQDTQLKKLASSWPTAAWWFAITALVMIVARVESISYVSMRLWWGVWAIFAILFIVLQYKVFAARYYTVVEKRARKKLSPYLPRKRK
jgi:uncharacterized membrane protein